ncbi:MAG: hypothetical protein J6K84_02295 [Oscillospiraceae bacterium]|nr:hypothetical protein [Oscillospiraceae bacterium]
MRKNFYEMLSQRDFDAQKEYSTLWNLFCVEKSYYNGYSSYSLAAWVDLKLFRNFPFRGSFTSLKEMMGEFGLHIHSAADVDKLFLFCELLAAVLPSTGAPYDTSLFNQKRTIFENIGYILEHTNHEMKKDPNGRQIIVEKNKSAILAAQLVPDTAVAFELIEYNHFAIKGHLPEKKRILADIANYIEPILKSKTLGNAGYKQLESDAGFVFNNFHIRHNNKEGAKAQDYIVALDSKELEEWYDKAYELAISVIIVNDYLSIGKDIKDVKEKYTWRT